MIGMHVLELIPSEARLSRAVKRRGRILGFAAKCGWLSRACARFLSTRNAAAEAGASITSPTFMTTSNSPVTLHLRLAMFVSSIEGGGGPPLTPPFPVNRPEEDTCCKASDWVGEGSEYSLLCFHSLVKLRTNMVHQM